MHLGPYSGRDGLCTRQASFTEPILISVLVFTTGWPHVVSSSSNIHLSTSRLLEESSGITQAKKCPFTTTKSKPVKPQQVMSLRPGRRVGAMSRGTEHITASHAWLNSSRRQQSQAQEKRQRVTTGLAYPDGTQAIGQDHHEVSKPGARGRSPGISRGIDRGGNTSNHQR